MSGIRAVDLGLVMPDRDDPPPVRARQLSYDFSRWNDTPEEEPVANDALPVSFKVYTPDEIKAAPLPVRRTPPPPPPDDGIKDVQEALAIAKELGTKGLLARFAVGIAAGAIMLVSLVMFATLADDSHESRGILTASTETPSAAPALTTIQALTMPTSFELIGGDDVKADDSSYFELPDQSTPKTAKRPTGKAVAAKRTIVRNAPF